VPLVAAKREYVLLPPQPRADGGTARSVTRGIGMDDPLLAHRLEETALNAGADSRPAALTYRITAREGRGRSPRLEPGGKVREPRKAERPLDILLQAARSEQSEEPRRNPVRELLVTMLLTSVGVAAAYHLSHAQGMDPTLWVGAGGVWGLILGWLCIQWMRQR